MSGENEPIASFAELSSKGTRWHGWRRTRPRGLFARWSYNWLAVVAVVGLLATGGLALLSLELSDHNERHLLNLRTREVAAAFTTELSSVQTPLAALAALANLGAAGPQQFAQFAAAYVGAGRPFVSMSVWRSGDLDAGPVDVIGQPPELASNLTTAGTALDSAVGRAGLTVWPQLHGPRARIDFAYAGPSPGPFVIEAEQAVPADRVTPLLPRSAYADLNVAAYLARGPVPADLVLRTVRRLPLPGERASDVVAFGSATLTVVVSAKGLIEGPMPERMHWVIAAVGLLLTVLASLLTLRLITGRRRAQRLAEENRGLYAEQQEIAHNLQHALLPRALPTVPGVRLAGRYAAGDPQMDIGGDWYDILRLDEARLMLVVGDVTGRGLRAATAMTSLRFAIQYAARTSPPEVFLPQLSDVSLLREQDQLATILCAVVDLDARTVSVTSAGHLPPLMIAGDGAEYLLSPIGLPVGVDRHARYVPATFTVPPGAMLLGFTDGLVERRRETLDDGLERFRAIAIDATAKAADIDAVINVSLARLRVPESIDDTAVAGIQWMT